MEASFVVCLLAASITLVLGMSQECTICQSSGKNCQGDKETCSAPKDKCSVTLLEKTVGPTTHAIKKSCIHPQECNQGLAVLDMGNKQIIQGHVSCCEDNQCTNHSSMPARKIVTTNNKRCPACSTEPKEQSGCQEKLINCTGEDEMYCAEVFLQKKEGGKNMTVTMKGCANKAFCEKMEISAVASAFTLLPNSNCKNATGAVDTTVGSFGLFLSAQAGLLLVTIFS
ncbi:phospholipase A2 inhibitor and Ly6/PLAUR domain-containing protein-like isoform X1 [Crotalus tigris]|uniref:phospholipase A2 inhibitor and Ly6/PLAUR domain-containing protein-like isoform X1 n=2 Tax=Crotalus tigris TaxID=88082 RepID=UPI00192F35D5|nr:phospholipase A2 inhibitor and Ly6/PLAUR domain-containing protein-like isoform X1 [Crotalus tigris]